MNETRTVRECLRRALRTFVQSACGYIAVNIIYVVTQSAGDFDALRCALGTLCVSAVAAGIAAVMNLPSSASTEAKDEKEED